MYPSSMTQVRTNANKSLSLADQVKYEDAIAQKKDAIRRAKADKKGLIEVIETNQETTFTVYEGTVKDDIQQWVSEWKLHYTNSQGNDTTATAVRGREAIVKSLWWEEKITEYNSWDINQDWCDATVFLKTKFAKYKDQFADLRDLPCWSWNTDIKNGLRLTYAQMSRMYEMIDLWSKDYGVPYAGWQHSDGEHCWPDSDLCAWLPLRVGGKSVCVWSGSDDHEASLDRGDGQGAQPSVSLN